MPRRNDIAKILIIGSGLVLFSCLPLNALPKPQAKARCSPDLEHVTERIFANPGPKGWIEYGKVEEVPPLSLDSGEQMFAVSLSSSGRRYVRSVAHGEDSSTFQSYCFSPAGSLQSIRYEMRTAWGWGYVEERFFAQSGKTLQRTMRFFNTATSKTIPRPRQADDVPDFLRPTIYRSFNSLLFVPILKLSRVNATP